MSNKKSQPPHTPSEPAWGRALSSRTGPGVTWGQLEGLTQGRPLTQHARDTLTRACYVGGRWCWPNVPSGSGSALRALPGLGHRAGRSMAAVPESCPGHLHHVWNSRVKQHESRPLGTPTRGSGWTDGGDSMVEATHSFSLSLAWLEARPSGAKPGLRFCMRADEAGSWFD